MSNAPSISVVIAPSGVAAVDLPLAGVDEVIVVGEGDLPVSPKGCAIRRVRSNAPAGQRANIGISLASGEWIAVLSGTERLAADWPLALTATVSNGEACAHRWRPQNGGLPLTAVWRPAFAYGALDGCIDNAAQALEHWVADIFPRHRHRVLPREGVAEHEAAWLQSGAVPCESTQGSVRTGSAAVGNGYDPQSFWEAGGSGWVKWEAFQPDEAEIREIVEKVQPRQVLELGCGGGRNARYFAGAERYAGIDLSMSLLARARDRQEANGIGLVCGDASRLPFADGSFDLVFAVSTIQHVVPARIAACVSDIVRVARRQICLIEFTDELPGSGGWFDQPHMFRHDYASLLAPHAELRLRRPTALQIQPAVKEVFLFEKRH
jgi:hypothetical protein